MFTRMKDRCKLAMLMNMMIDQSKTYKPAYNDINHKLDKTIYLRLIIICQIFDNFVKFINEFN